MSCCRRKEQRPKELVSRDLTLVGHSSEPLAGMTRVRDNGGLMMGTIP